MRLNHTFRVINGRGIREIEARSYRIMKDMTLRFQTDDGPVSILSSDWTSVQRIVTNDLGRTEVREQMYRIPTK